MHMWTCFCKKNNTKSQWQHASRHALLAPIQFDVGLIAVAPSGYFAHTITSYSPTQPLLARLMST